MVKKKVGGGKRYQLAAKALKAKDSEQAQHQSGPAVPKHLSRKITKKVGFLERVQASRDHALAVKPAIKKKVKVRARKAATGALADLSALAATLGDIPVKAESKQNPARKPFGAALKGPKARNAVTQKESTRLLTVLRHPMFAANPLDAITAHLKANVPAAPVPLPVNGRGRGKADKKGAKTKSAAAVARGPARMDADA